MTNSSTLDHRLETDTVEKIDALGARMAKALISDVLATAVRHGVQFHGGYGFTIDCDVHFYFKRALFCRGMLGDAIHHRRHLAADLFGDAA